MAYMAEEKTRRAAEEVAELEGIVEIVGQMTKQEAVVEHEAVSAELQGGVQDRAVHVGVAAEHEAAMAELQGMVQDMAVNVATVQSQTERVDQGTRPFATEVGTAMKAVQDRMLAMEKQVQEMEEQERASKTELQGRAAGAAAEHEAAMAELQGRMRDLEESAMIVHRQTQEIDEGTRSVTEVHGCKRAGGDHRERAPDGQAGGNE